MTPLQETFYSILGVGALVSAVLAFIAGRLSGHVVPLILLGVSVLIFWMSLLFGADLGYRAWQSIPNPPAEAFNDASPAFFMIGGWIPGGAYVSYWYGLSWLVRLYVWKPRVLDAILADESNGGDGDSASVETGNAYQPPKS
ncbi:hypothetical protein OAH34_00960 [bacterium]|nr:hypothetical protein [Rubripirellula sp.]MDB4338476.1 hypothetical protein [Rubripirellula sp.]MDB4809744.1 hypothetical protein [bacterium]